MKIRVYLKQVALFLLAVILPSSVLVVFTVRMVRQEELLEKRAFEQRNFRLASIASRKLARLERLKLEEVTAETG